MNTKPNAASVALFSGNNVLLIKRAKPPFKDCWSLPGGRLEAGETTKACACREVFEELGLKLDTLTPVTHLTVGSGFLLQIFACDWHGDAPIPNDEIADWQWTALGDVGQLRTTPHLFQTLTLAAQSLNKT